MFILPNSDYAGYINVDEGLKRVANNKKLFLMLLDKFVKDTRIDALETELKNGNSEAAAVVAHTIKGVAGNLSLSAIFTEVQQLEAQIKAGQDVSEGLAAFKVTVGKTLENIDLLKKEFTGA